MKATPASRAGGWGASFAATSRIPVPKSPDAVPDGYRAMAGRQSLKVLIIP